jgi:hypothetical protein
MQDSISNLESFHLASFIVSASSATFSSSSILLFSAASFSASSSALALNAKVSACEQSIG